jgi:hypothetical protein
MTWVREATHLGGARSRSEAVVASVAVGRFAAPSGGVLTGWRPVGCPTQASPCTLGGAFVDRVHAMTGQRLGASEDESGGSPLAPQHRGQ